MHDKVPMPEAGRPEEEDLGKVKLKIPLIPGVASWDYEISAHSLLGRVWTRRPLAVRVGMVGIVLALVALVGFGGWRLLVHEAPETPELYAVRVVPIDESGQPARDSIVRSSVGNEPQRVEGGWEIEIPRSKVPQGGEVTFWAEDRASGGRGGVEVSLGSDPTPSIQVPLEIPATQVRGTVVDPEGRSLEGARVSVLGYGEESVVTGESGGFVLPAHRGVGEQVRLHVEHPGHPAKEQYCFAGGGDCYVRLSASPEPV